MSCGNFDEFIFDLDVFSYEHINSLYSIFDVMEISDYSVLISEGLDLFTNNVFSKDYHILLFLKLQSYDKIEAIIL